MSLQPSNNLEYDAEKLLSPALNLVRREIEPDRLSTVQEAVFSRCWTGDAYQEIADTIGYDAIYIRGIGAQIWKRLTEAFGEKVNKSNFQTIIRQRLSDPSISQRAESSALSATQSPNSGLASTEAAKITREDYYVQRPPIEKRCYEAIEQQGALIRIKAPKQMGKTLLMTKILQHAKNHSHYYTVIVNL